MYSKIFVLARIELAFYYVRHENRTACFWMCYLIFLHELLGRGIARHSGFERVDKRRKCSTGCNLLYVSEPTNNIAPKIPGKKYEGGEIYSVYKGWPAYLLCQVSGFPAPFFRYRYSFFFSSV